MHIFGLVGYPTVAIAAFPFVEAGLEAVGKHDRRGLFDARVAGILRGNSGVAFRQRCQCGRGLFLRLAGNTQRNRRAARTTQSQRIIGFLYEGGLQTREVLGVESRNGARARGDRIASPRGQATGKVSAVQCQAGLPAGISGYHQHGGQSSSFRVQGIPLTHR